MRQAPCGLVECTDTQKQIKQNEPGSAARTQTARLCYAVGKLLAVGDEPLNQIGLLIRMIPAAVSVAVGRKERDIRAASLCRSDHLLGVGERNDGIVNGVEHADLLALESTRTPGKTAAADRCAAGEEIRERAQKLPSTEAAHRQTRDGNAVFVSIQFLGNGLDPFHDGECQMIPCHVGRTLRGDSDDAQTVVIGIALEDLRNGMNCDVFNVRTALTCTVEKDDHRQGFFCGIKPRRRGDVAGQRAADFNFFGINKYVFNREYILS